MNPQTIQALAQEIVNALGLDESVRDSVIEELSTCSNERLMEMTKSLESYYQNVIVTANQLSSQIIRDGNMTQENEERAEFDTTLSLI